MLVVQPEAKAAIDFYWKGPEAASKAGISYGFKVTDAQGATVFERRTPATHLQVSLSPGVYRWRVATFRSTDAAAPSLLAITEPRLLELTRQEAGAERRGVISGLLRRGAHGSVYLSPGL